MTPSVTIIGGDCLDRLASLPDNSVDSVVTDPPYGLSNTDPAKVAETLASWVSGEDTAVPPARGGFMGASWDSFVPPPAVWKECMRVLKPGGHLAVFAGSRTQDLMGLSIRLAGFEIRDGLVWLYGSGFPKGQDLGKAIDKKLGVEREVVGTAKGARNGNGENVDYGAFGSAEDGTYTVTASSSEEARKWDGWNSQLKPGQEPIILARKPFSGPLVDNVMEHGTGALNIDGTRIPMSKGDQEYIEGRIGGFNNVRSFGGDGIYGGGEFMDRTQTYDPSKGRYPANVLMDDHAAAALDEQTGTLTSGKMKPTHVNPERTVYGQHAKGGYTTEETYGDSGGASRFFPVFKSEGRYPANVLLDEHAAAALDEQTGNLAVAGNKSESLRSGTDDGPAAPRTTQVPTYAGGPTVAYKDSGGASRFFPVFKYQAKAPKRERPVIEDEDGTKIQHPTVKPLALMDWLVTLITPPGGTVLDPFAGTGATLQAARDAGFASIGIEAHDPYIRLIMERLGK